MTVRASRGIAALLLAAAIAVTSVLGASAQPISSAVSVADHDAIRAIAAALSPASDKTDRVLDAVGFAAQARTIPGFADWPAVRKIETTYLSAVAAGGPAEGQRFLQITSHVIAEDHSDAVRYEPALKGYFSGASVSRADRASLHYASLPSSVAQPTDSATRDAILAMERYVERVPGGMQTVIYSCCGFTSPDIYDLLRISATREDALIRAVVGGKLPPELQERLLRLVRAVAEGTHAVAYEPALAPYLSTLAERRSSVSPVGPAPSWRAGDEQKLTRILRQAGYIPQTGRNGRRTPHPTPPPPPATSAQDNLHAYQERQADAGHPRAFDDDDRSPRGIGPSGGGEGSAGERAFLRESAALGKGRVAFEIMSVAEGGFGGVVFGAPLVASDVSKPLAIVWAPEDSAAGAWGRLDVVTGEGVQMSRRMRSDDVFAAWEILHGRPPAFSALSHVGWEGVGLASVNGDGDASPMVTHPALYGFPIGDDAVMADAIGFAMNNGAFERALVASGAGPDAIRQAVAWKKGRHGYYKIVDAPLRAVVRDGLLRVERADPVSYPPALKRVAFLRFVSLKDGQAEPESATQFYEALPTLIAAFPAIAHLNDFAETFAILRWAGRDGVSLASPPAVSRLDARLFIREASDGSLDQSTQDLTNRQAAAAQLAQIRSAAVDATAALQNAGAPLSAAEFVAKVATIQEQRIMLAVAAEDLESTSARSRTRQLLAERVADRLEGQSEDLAAEAPELRAMGATSVALALPVDVAALRDALVKRRAAQEERAQSHAHLRAIENVSADDDDARSGSVAPPATAPATVDPSKLKRALDEVAAKDEAFKAADDQLRGAIRAREPWLLTAWPKIQAMAKLMSEGNDEEDLDP